MRKALKFILAAALAVLPSTPLFAQSSVFWPPWVKGETAVANVAALSTDTVLLVRYVGTNANGGSVTVAAGGDITLAQGAVGSSTADATVKCPSGGSNGVIDVSDTACDTLGEVVDKINGSANWRAVILDGMRADSSNDTLAALSETAANSVGGLGLLNDTAVTFDVTRAIVPERTMVAFIDSRVNGFIPNPYFGTRTNVWKINETTTFGSGTSTIEVWSCVVNQGNTVPSTGITTGATETCVQLESVAGGATTVEKTVEYTYGLFGAKNAKVLVRVNNSAANTASRMYAYGIQFRY
jgi:hypothetical protein